jgi:hypothetical protein
MAITKETKDFIQATLDELGVEKYTINDDGTVDVAGDVDLKKKGLDEIPVQFGFILGDFSVQRNNLTSLKGSPVAVKSSFNCMNNKLETLKHSPVYVGNDFACSRNNLQDLDGAPMLVRGDFGCSFNESISANDAEEAETIIQGQFIF